MPPDALQGPVPTARAAADSTAGIRSAGSVAVLVLADMRPTARWWAWGRLVLGARPFHGVPGLQFVKVMGSGQGGGFGLKPSGTHRGLFLGFDTEAAARHFIEQDPQLAAWRAQARECLVTVLRASSSKGSWSGAAMQVTAETPNRENGPIAVLTRASIKPLRARAFWRLAPPAEASLERAEGCLLAAGLGEAPVLRQCTFSLWHSTAAMDAYARSGAHQQAIRAAYGGGHFSESMFVRFVPLLLQGRWQGQAHG